MPMTMTMMKGGGVKGFRVKKRLWLLKKENWKYSRIETITVIGNLWDRVKAKEVRKPRLGWKKESLREKKKFLSSPHKIKLYVWIKWK